MKNVKHTPGPWMVDQNDQFIHVIEPISGIGPCSIPLNGGEMREEDIANARLIAAAPDMLVMLNETLSRLPLEMNLEGEMFRDALVSVIAKATGGAE